MKLAETAQRGPMLMAGDRIEGWAGWRLGRQHRVPCADDVNFDAFADLGAPRPPTVPGRAWVTVGSPMTRAVPVDGCRGCASDAVRTSCLAATFAGVCPVSERTLPLCSDLGWS
jgi:hypothetical protein